MPSTLALIRNMFLDDKQRATAVAVWTGGLIGGVTVGPIVGGVLLDHFWWGSVFLINLPAMALLLVLGPVLLPEFRAPRTGHRFDVAGSLLSMGAIFPAVYGVKELAVDGFSATSAAALAAGLVLGTAFVVRQRTAANPLVDVELFGKPAFRAPLLVNVAGNFVLLGFGLFNTQYLQSVAGMRPFTAALWSLAAMPFVSAGMGVVGALGGKVRPARLISGSLAASAAGALVLTLAHPGMPVIVLTCGAGIASGGVVAAQSIVGALVMGAAPAERAGSASALNETAGEFGGAMGMALLGSVGAAFYHHKMAAVGAAGLPTDAVHAARETVGSAAAVAGQFHSAAGNALLHSARDAYSSGLHLAAVGGAAVLVMSALFALRALRDVPIPAPAPKKEKHEKPAEHQETVAVEVVAEV
jgi:DHA2 family multidrug resistance protein-like MFS transporter